MLRYFLCSCATLLSSLSFGQDAATPSAAQPFVIAFTQAFNNKDTKALEAMLAADFEMAGQKQPMATMVVQQVFKQLPGKLKGLKYLSTETKDDSLQVYDFNADYTALGERPLAITLHADGKLQNLDILGGIQVRNMASGGFDFTNEPAQLTLPFVRAGNLILVEAFVNGQKRNFLLDSGAPTLVLNSKYFKATHNDGENKILAAKGSGAGGDIGNLDIYHLDSFNLAGLSFENTDAITMDVAHLEKALHKEIYGLIGYEVFKQYDVLFDYGTKTITFLHSKKAAEQIQNLTNGKPGAAFELSAHIPVLQATIAGKTYRMGVDCGAEANLITTEKEAALKPLMGKLRKDEVVGAGKNKTFSYTGNIPVMTIAGIDFKDVQTTFSDISNLNTAYGLNIDGLIGYEILSRQRCVLSYHDKKLYFL